MKPDVQQELRVLIIDDDAAIRQGLAITVQSISKSRVDVAGDGAEGLKLLANEQYDLLFLDLMMPEVDGFEVLKAIRSGDAIRPNHTVIVSAWADMNSHIVPAVDLGADDMITKPFRPVQIKTAMSVAAGKTLSTERPVRTAA